MALTASQLSALKPTHKHQRVSCGNSLLLMVEPIKSDRQGGGKSFVGTTRFPSGRGGKQVDVRIGVYGKNSHQFTLKSAQVKWDEIRDWSKQEGKKLRDFPKQLRRELIKHLNAPSLQQDCGQHFAAATSKAAGRST